MDNRTGTGLNIPKSVNSPLTEEDILKRIAALPELLAAITEIAGDIERDLNVLAIIGKRLGIEKGLVKEREFMDLETEE